MSVIAQSNIQTLQTRIDEERGDAALLTFLPDIRWACGFTGSNGILLCFASDEERYGGAHFLSDGRYKTQAHREVREAEIHIPGYKLLYYVKEEGLLDGAETVLFQSEHVTVDQLKELEELFPEVRWKPVKELLTREVARKQADEIERIRKAQEVTEEVFSFLTTFIRPGMTEKEVAAELVYQHLRRGAERMSFDPIVASGPNAALPHARPSERRIEEGELLLIDMGCFLDGYASDMTRTVAVGEPGEEERKVYVTVLAAQKAAIEAARARMRAPALDRVARQVIDDAGYGSYFGHGLGHGVGLQIHEWPRVSYHVDYELPEGAAVTIEPGIYLPERFGVRIEDIVVLREGGCENLTAAPKELIIIDA